MTKNTAGRKNKLFLSREPSHSISQPSYRAEMTQNSFRPSRNKKLHAFTLERIFDDGSLYLVLPYHLFYDQVPPSSWNRSRCNRATRADQLSAKTRGLAFFNWLIGLSFFPISALVPYEIRPFCERGRDLTGPINSYICERALVSAPSTSFRIN